jgi:hypothetical protein
VTAKRELAFLTVEAETIRARADRAATPAPAGTGGDLASATAGLRSLLAEVGAGGSRGSSIVAAAAADDGGLLLRATLV